MKLIPMINIDKVKKGLPWNGGLLTACETRLVNFCKKEPTLASHGLANGTGDSPKGPFE